MKVIFGEKELHEITHAIVIYLIFIKSHTVSVNRIVSEQCDFDARVLTARPVLTY